MKTLYVLLPFVVFAINIFLAGIVLTSNWRSSSHRIFAVFLTSMALWGFTIFGMRSAPSLSMAYQWDKIALVIIPFVSIFFFHFSILFTYARTSRWVLRSLYGLGGLTAILSLSGVVATGMQLKWYGYAPVFGRAFPLYLAVNYLAVFLALRLLVKAYGRSHSSDERNRVSYVILAAVSSIVGGTTDYLPVLGAHLYPLGMISNILFGLLATVAVTRFQLMGLRVLARKGFAYSLISTIIFGVYGLIFLSFSFIFRNRTTAASLIATATALILATIALPPVLARIQTIVDRLFFRERYNHLLALEKFTSEAHDIGDFSGLSSSLTNVAKLAMQADWATLLLPHPASGQFIPVAAAGGASYSELVISRNSSLSRWLARNPGTLNIWDLEVDPHLQAMGDAQKQSLHRSGAQLFVPLKSKGKLTGILVLGAKLGEEDYSQEDIALLSTVASQAATLIENSRLYTQEMGRLQELEKLENLKSSLLRTVSHEIKSPLTAIKASVDLLSTPMGVSNERTTSRLNKALRSGVDRLERLVEESLDYAQMQSAHLELRIEAADLGKVIQEAVDLVEPAIRARRQNVTVDIAAGLPMLFIDTRRIERVILNLLTNANKFTPAEGTISVRVWQEGTEIVTSVADNGPGIPQKDQELLFHEYYRGSNADGQKNAGSGLGLAIGKYLVELHGGRIWVTSKVGEGAVFYFALPAVAAASQTLDPTSEKAIPKT